MLEIFKNFEQIAAQFSPSVLIGPGVAGILVGLFIWLGGMGLKRPLVAVAGAVTGSIFGFFVIGRNIISATVSAAIAAIIAIILERAFITILAAALAGAFGFAILAGPYIENSQAANPTNQEEMSTQATTMSVDESIEKLKAYALDVGEKIKQTCSQMPVQKWAIIAIFATILIIGGFFFWRLTSALCCSVLGTMLIFAGMIVLLLYKGAAPVSSICNKPSFYATVFIAMTAFGTIEQLFLFQRAKTKSARKGQAHKDKEEADKAKRDWRTT